MCVMWLFLSVSLCVSVWVIDVTYNIICDVNCVCFVCINGFFKLFGLVMINIDEYIKK